MAPPAGAAVPPEDGGSKCKRYEIVGIRGSGESIESPYGMNATVGGVADALVDVLGPRRVRTHSLPYPAAPVSDLLRDGGAPFYRSMALGRVLLERRVREVSRRCPKTRTAVIGYSQGAAVASEALRRMPGGLRRRVRAVILIADPWSAGQTGYAMTLRADGSGEPDQRAGGGGLGKRRSAISGRTLDVCFAGDLVCDLTSGTVEMLVQAALSELHSGYENCCVGFPLEIPLAHWAADKLRAGGPVLMRRLRVSGTQEGTYELTQHNRVTVCGPAGRLHVRFVESKYFPSSGIRRRRVHAFERRHDGGCARYRFSWRVTFELAGIGPYTMRYRARIGGRQSRLYTYREYTQD
jgi:pimeloyl-ACP methyl ester carboxylesterase